MIHVAKIGETFIDFPNAEDISVIIFTQGCSHACPGCHSYQLQFQSSEDNVLTRDEVYKAIKDRCRRNNTNKIVFSGGDPLYHSNNDEQMLELMSIISQLENEGYSCCMYTGYYYDQVVDIYSTYDPDNKFIHPDFIKCGEYVADKKEKEWGKTDNDFTLATTNQYFMGKVYDNPLSYNRISVNNKLSF